MIMKRKNIILSTILSLSIIISSACGSDDNTSTFVETSSITTITEETVLESTNVETAESISSEITSKPVEETTTKEIAITTEEQSTSAQITEGITTAEIVTTTITEIAPEVTEEITIITEDEKVTKEEMVEKKYIALTFDDGPNTTTTHEVLDVLEQYGIKGSFFLIGNNINSDSEKAVKRAYDMGCDIGNHSKSHPYMNELSVDDIKAEIEYVDEYILKITGEKPKFFRPPYIAINNTMYDTIDLTFISGFGCNDWDDKVTAERRAKVIIRQAQDGGIILLHDAQGNSKTVEALHTIIPELQKQGYEFVTLTELFQIKGIDLNPNDSNLYTFVGK